MHEGPIRRPQTHSTPIAERKKALRSELRQARRRRRDETSARQRELDGVRLADVAAPLLDGVTCVTLFEPTATEANVAALTQRLLEHGVRVLVPITLEDLDLSWRDLATGQDLGLDGIAAADLVLAPALAIGPDGERLGQGGGCYDRALPRRRPGVPVVAVAHPSEVGLDLPTEPHDERVDGVLTSEGLARFPHAVRAARKRE